LFICRHFFALSEAAAPPEQDGETLASDAEALKIAELIADDLGRNGSRPRISVFNAEGKRIKHDGA
jgi:hypothetical protein